MAKSSVHTLARPSFWGRVGNLAGQGLSEAIPKEAERLRLSEGLSDLANNKANLTPEQYLAKVASVPGALEHPQLIQSFGELSKQRQKGEALNQRNPVQVKPQTFPRQISAKKGPQGSEIPSLTQEQTFARAQEGFIPPSQEEILDKAAEDYNANPAFFNYDPNKAIEMKKEGALREEKIAEAYQKKHENLSNIQDNVVKRLGNHAKSLGVEIPPDYYSEIENKAIQATKPKSEGGSGLTEQQAMKQFGKELDEVSREYADIEPLGGWGIVGQKPEETLRSLRSLQDKFDKRNDTENLAQKLIGIDLSPKLAYAIAQPVQKEPALNSAIKNLPSLIGSSNSLSQTSNSKSPQKTLEISKKLAPLLGDKGSPQAVAYELDKLGYDPSVWLNYLSENSRSLNLRAFQENQIRKTNKPNGTMNDWWLTSWSGLDRGAK